LEVFGQRSSDGVHGVLASVKFSREKSVSERC
jgi:hypothetical protein